MCAANAVVPRDCMYIHRRERTCVDTCVSGDAVIDVAAHPTFLLASPMRSLFLCLFFSFSLFLSFFPSLFFSTLVFFTRILARKRAATREQELESGMQLTAREQLLFWQRFLQCHRDENNSQDNYCRASFILRHHSPSFRISSETCVLYRQRVPCLDAAETLVFLYSSENYDGSCGETGKRDVDVIAILRTKLFFFRKDKRNLNFSSDANVHENIIA